MHNKRQCLIGIILKSQKGGQVSRKRGTKGRLERQGIKRGQFGSYAHTPRALETQKAELAGFYYGGENY